MFRIPAITAVAIAVTISLMFAQGQPTNTSPQQPTNTSPPRPGNASPQPGTPPGGGGIIGRPSPPQPLQKQTIDYFVGTWSFKWTGRESGLTAGPRTATVTFTRLGDTPFLDMRAEGKVDGGAAYKESATLGWHDGQKVMAMHERIAVGGGIDMLSVGDWSSPIAVRFESAPIKVGAQTLRMKRIFSIISATSFTVAEELSTDGGPYVRLGSGVYTKTTR